MQNPRLIIVLILLVALGLVYFLFFYKSEEARIKEEIAEASYCFVDTDCQMVALSSCPFGCYVHVNRNEAVRIGAMIEGYKSTCMYSCLEFKGVQCVNNTCQLKE
jgi:hypothetical protein